MQQPNYNMAVLVHVSIVIPSYGQVTHALLARPPLSSLNVTPKICSKIIVPLACVLRHAASVRPGAGSNPRLNGYI